jgi:hypothetical protein
MTSAKHATYDDFSLVAGGPMFRLLCLLRLSGKSLEYLPRRVFASALIAWLPLLVLAALEGHALGGDIALPLLRDWETGLRFLVALPLLFWADSVSHEHLGKAVAQFRTRELVPQAQLERFDAALRSAARLRDSTLAELVFVALVFGFGIQVVWRKFTVIPVATWYGAPAADGMTISLAGMWLIGISLPLFHFMLMRWYYRLYIWGRLLRQISKVDLALVATHPDRAGGLGFLGHAVHYFVPVALTHGALLAGWVGNRIFTLGAALTDFKIEIALFVILGEVLIIGPLLIFVPTLAKTKWAGHYEYGALAVRYVRSFDHKWLRGGAPASAPFVGSADIQSLADMDSSYAVVHTMRLTLFTKESILLIAAATLTPVLPLMLTMMNTEEWIKKLFAILL